MHSRSLASLVLIASCLTGAVGAQDRVQLVLHYEAPADCPDATGFRDRVVSRLGYDPFVEQGAPELDVDVAGSREGYRARVRAGGSSQGERRLGPAAHCADVIGAAATTLSILLDPLGMPSSPPVIAPPEPVQPIAPPAPVAAPAAVALPAPPPPRVADVSLALHAGGAAGFLPQPALELDAMGGARVSDWTFSIGARLRHPFSDVSVGGEAISLGLYTGLASACGRLDFFIACAEAELGAVVLESTPLAGGTRSELFASVGARAGVSFDVRPGLSIEALVGLSVTPTPVRLWIDNAVAWEALPIGGSLVLGAQLTPGLWQ